MSRIGKQPVVIPQGVQFNVDGRTLVCKGPKGTSKLPLFEGINAKVEAGKVVLDGVYNDVKDPDGFRDECRQGADMGFDGKTLIHPSQVDIANEVWAPSASEIERAERIIAAFDEALAEGRGVVTVDGRMIENLHVDEARRVLAVAAAIARTTQA